MIPGLSFVLDKAFKCDDLRVSSLLSENNTYFLTFAYILCTCRVFQSYILRQNKIVDMERGVW